MPADDIYPLCKCTGYKLAFGVKPKPEQALMDIRPYTLRLNVDPSTKSITGSTEIDRILTAIFANPGF